MYALLGFEQYLPGKTTVNCVEEGWGLILGAAEVFGRRRCRCDIAIQLPALHINLVVMRYMVVAA